MASDLAWMTIEQAAPLVASRQLSPRDLVEAVLERVAQVGRGLNAFITVDGERARAAAVRAEVEILRRGCRGPLHGVPVALQDNIWTAGLRTTAGSRILAAFVPVEDATVVRRLRRAGAIVIGKTNMSEFGCGATSENAHYGPAHNPWDYARISGGSSGGSAAAVAAGCAYAALGTDTAGSLRIPAALCGVLGLKPTFGRVSCRGTMPLVPAYDHVGAIARSPADLAIVLRAIAGRDAGDPATCAAPIPDTPRRPRRPRQSFRLGRPREYFFDRLAPEVALAVDGTLRVLEACGARLREVRLPALPAEVARCTAYALAEATMVHRRIGFFPGRTPEYGRDLRRRLEAGAAVRAQDYTAAAEAKRVIDAAFAAALADVDAIVAPTAPVTATLIGEGAVTLDGATETVTRALIRLTRPANIAGLPSLTVPCGRTSSRLPIGLQIIAPPFAEERLLRIAQLYVEARGEPLQWPTRVWAGSERDA